jgi:hypothetical protein
MTVASLDGESQNANCVFLLLPSDLCQSFLLTAGALEGDLGGQMEGTSTDTEA